MSLFQCFYCGCVENTALSACGFTYVQAYDWAGKENLKGKELCSACGPEKNNNGTPSRKGGGWHGKFDRVYLPKGMFTTNGKGNLENILTGDDDYMKYEIKESDSENEEE